MTIELFTKEHVIHYMLTEKIKLSHYDLSFIRNMEWICHDKKRVTSRQAELFDKLIIKYRKQFYNNGLEAENLCPLPWKSEVVTSDKVYTNAHLNYDRAENILTLRVPFNKNFISEFRRSRTLIETPWIWNKDKKRYEAVPSTYSLKLAYRTLPKFFEVQYHNEVRDIITELKRIEATKEFWNPTLTMVDGEYKVVESNEVLDELLKDIKLDNSPRCLYSLSQLAIDIDPKILDSEELRFASSYNLDLDYTKIENMALWLSKLPCDLVYFKGLGHSAVLGNGSVQSINIFQNLKQCLNKYNINLEAVEKNNSVPARTRIESDKPIVLVRLHTHMLPEFMDKVNIGKIINLQNGDPVKA